MIEPGPAYTIVRRGRDVYGRHWLQVRKRGGQETRVVVPDIFATEAELQAVAAHAATRIPELPGPWAL